MRAAFRPLPRHFSRCGANLQEQAAGRQRFAPSARARDSLQATLLASGTAPGGGNVPATVHARDVICLLRDELAKYVGVPCGAWRRR